MTRWSAAALLEHPWLQEVPASQEQERPRSPSPPPAPVQVAGLPGQSRLNQDFEVLSWIGKGGFGDVRKVRNLLDDQVYAIKSIRLNPADKGTNRKIMREVKLLSRLNHENVVRYYNSWHELTTTTSSTDTSETNTTSEETEPSSSAVTSLGLGLKSFRPPEVMSSTGQEWSVSWLPQVKHEVFI